MSVHQGSLVRPANMLSYETSLKVHTSADKMLYAHPPFWIERRSISKVSTPPYTFYEDPVRGTLIHARSGRTQVAPMNRGEARSLYPDKCTGIWFLPTLDLARQLQAVEIDMLAAFARVQEVGQTPSIEDITLAGYLRQLFDHFLNFLFAKHNPASSTIASGGPGSFGNPLPLLSVEEPHMKNALNNKAAGQSYRIGAWTVEDSGVQASQGDGQTLPPSGRKRSIGSDIQPVEPMNRVPVSAQAVPAFASHLSRSSPQETDQPGSDPKRRRMQGPQPFPHPEPWTKQPQQDKINNHSHSRMSDFDHAPVTGATVASASIEPPEVIIILDSDSDSESDVGDWETYVYIEGRPVCLTTSIDGSDDRHDNTSTVNDAFLAGLLF
ncbi:hypothetical protein FRC05_010583 [Tulasnella sp. 425]|nr:hypothetical protein FRC05_010583 [Tulasnella sp. 425]